MTLRADRFSKVVVEALSESERCSRIRELQAFVNLQLAGRATLGEFQSALYAQIEQLCSLGYSLGRWEYDCEVEIWGGPSYMDPLALDDLLLKSSFPDGVSLAWRDYDQLLPDA